MLNRLTLLLVMLLLIINLLGCSTTGARTLQLKVKAADDINPNENNQASPLVVTVYQLKNIDKFNTADFFSLYQSPQQTLTTDYLGSEQFIFLPDKSYKLDLNLSKNTTYIGIVAAYHNINHALWLASQPIKDKKSTLTLDLNQSQVKLTK